MISRLPDAPQAPDVPVLVGQLRELAERNDREAMCLAVIHAYAPILRHMEAMGQEIGRLSGKTTLLLRGLHFEVSTQEFGEHLAARREYHIGRTKFYAEEVSRLEAGKAEPGRYSSGDPTAALRSNAERHEALASKFDFLLKHLIDGATYRLDESELVEVEFIKRTF